MAAGNSIGCRRQFGREIQQVKSAEQVIADTQVEFLHGVPVSVRPDGAKRILQELKSYGYTISRDPMADAPTVAGGGVIMR